MSSELICIGSEDSIPIECSEDHRTYDHEVSSWMVAVKIQRDSHDVKALSLISEKIARDIRRLADKFNLSVIEVLNQAVRLFERSGFEKQRSAVRTFWEGLTPEERRARASRASRARWDAENAKKEKQSEKPRRKPGGRRTAT